MKGILRLAGLSIVALAQAAAAPPQITAIFNAASYARAGLPNSGIAAGSVFVILGTDLGPARLQQADSFPLPLTLGGTSVRVTVDSTVVDAIMVYTSANKVSAILPSNTPLGIGLLAVTYQGHTSEAGAFRVQRSAPGIQTKDQSGIGLAVATNFNSVADQPMNGLTRAAHPGQVVTLFGTGLGPIVGDDAAAPVQQDLNLNVQVLVGGKPAKIRYKGRSDCCAGIDQIAIEIPAGVDGCYVPVAVRVDDAVSNFATISVASSGDVCTDLNGVSGADLVKLQNGGTIAWGVATLSVNQDCGDDDSCYFSTPPTKFNEYGSASFQRAGLYPNAYQVRLGLPSLGSCVVSPAAGLSPVIFPEPAPLDAGPVLNLTGPKGTMQLTSNFLGNYYRQFSSLVTELQFLQPGNYVLDNGTGGPDVGPFKATLTIPKAFTSNVEQSADTAKISWSGGDPSGYVIVQGSGVAAPNGANVGFLCTERVAAGQFMIPPEVLLSLPPHTAGHGIPVSASSPVMAKFQAKGLDIGQFLYFGAPLQ
jgi:uncharacterized protein (TIGR03437 family)